MWQVCKIRDKVSKDGAKATMCGSLVGNAGLFKWQPQFQTPTTHHL